MRELLDRGGIILAANARAARALHLRYAEAKQAEHGSAWPTPRILDLHSWLAEQWNSLLMTGTEGRILLNELQETALWERLIEPQLAGISLIEPARMAMLAQQAYALLAEYNQLARLNDAIWLPEPNSEPEVFRSWARSFQRECARHGWLPRSELAGVITHAIRFGMLEPPPELGWLGFDRAVPAEADLRMVLESLGTRQQELTWNTEPTPPCLYTAQSENQETIACAAWARRRLEENPKARIGILMPDLESRRAQLERDLYRLLSPAQFPITAGASPNLPFEFSLGQPLAQVPLVHAALLLLRWLDRPLLQQEISWLLLSSTLGAALRSGARESLAHLDRRLRGVKCAPPELSLEEFLRHPGHGVPAVRELAHDLAAMLEQHRRPLRDASAGEWVRRIAHLLHTARWAERADASSLLFQAREAWDRLLDTIATLDLVNRPLSFRRFLTTLERAAQDTIFAAESTGAPVQVMSAYAASGQSFDAVWFLGATDAAWPIPGRVNPLLPLALQRDAGMPHASPAEDTALAHRAMERIAAGAGQVIYSWAVMSDEAMQRPSALVSHFAPIAVTNPEPSQSPVTLDTIQDDRWVPFPADAAVSSGGQLALKRQANCPFQAFVFQRLQVRELSVAGHGLSPADRGNLFHKVMELIWSDKEDPHLSSHADLLHAMAAGTLRPLVATRTDDAMRWLDPAQTDAWQRAYIKAEKERTVNLVMDWLDVESQRQPFQVAQVEQKIAPVVGGLALSARADRIDEVPGGKLLIDYKTGEVSTAGWDGPRPGEPQLPLYAVFGNTPDLVGAVFAQTRWPKDKMQFKGRIQDARASLCATLKDKDPLLAEPYTPELVEGWRETLENLSAKFVRGEAQIDPHVYPKSCQYCELHGLCRVAESRAMDAALDAEDDEDSE